MGKTTKVSKSAPKKKGNEAKQRCGRKATPKHSAVLACRARPVAPSTKWTKVTTLGESLKGVLELRKGHDGEPWNFDHTASVIRRLLEENPGKDAFLFGGSPHPIGQSMKFTPNMVVILFKTGETPPPFICHRNYQTGGGEIKTLAECGLSWKKFNNDFVDDPNHQGRVFTLCSAARMSQNSVGRLSLDCNEYLVPFIMRPSRDFQTEENDNTKLYVRFAEFQFHHPIHQEEISEEFDRDDCRLNRFVPDFLTRHDLVGDDKKNPDYETHHGAVAEAIKDAFTNKRNMLQERKNLFQDYSEEDLESAKVVKIYPQNDCINATTKSNQFNEYYGPAHEVV